MGVLSVTNPYSNGDAVTSVNLNSHVTDATFSSGAKDGVTIDIDGSGALYVKSIGTAQIANDAVTPDKIDLANAGTFLFANAAAQKHYSYQYSGSHSSAGALTFNISNGNFQLITVGANITSVAAISNAFTGAHFTFVLKYSGAGLSQSGAWDSAWLFPSVFDGSLTMTDGAYDLISGVIVDDGGTKKYIVSSVLNLVNP